MISGCFEILHVPSLLDGELDPKAAEIRQAEAALWGAISDILALNAASDATTGPSVEFAFVSDLGKRNRIYLRVHDVASDSPALRVLEAALPRHYSWQSRGSIDDFRNLSDAVWQVARLERRLEYLDLPWKLPELESSQATEGNSIRDQRDLDVHLDRQLVSFWTTPKNLLSERHCLPTVAEVPSQRSGMSTFFRELRLNGPAIVSIVLSAMPASRIDQMSRMAVLWLASAAPLGDIVERGMSHPTDLFAQYHRLLLPSRFLIACQVRVSAPSANSARMNALHYLARFGGLRSFMIREPVPMKLQDMPNPWLDGPYCDLFSDSKRVNRRDRLFKELMQVGIDVTEVGDELARVLIEWPHVYEFSDAKLLASLPIADIEGLPGIDCRLAVPFSSSPGRLVNRQFENKLSSDRIRIGIATDIKPDAGPTSQSQPSDWHTIARDSLTRHAAVFGGSGSGKTFTTTFIARELARLGVPFLIVEPVKTEYYDALRHVGDLGLRRFRLEGDIGGKPVADFLAFDPMRLQQGVSVARHASYLKSCFEAAFPMEPALALVLEAGIRDYYTHRLPSGCNLTMFTRGSSSIYKMCKKTSGEGNTSVETVVHPSLRGFQLHFLDVFLPKAVPVGEGGSRQSELQILWRSFFTRRFEALQSSMIGCAARLADARFLSDPHNYDPYSDLLSGAVIIELDGIPDGEQKSLLMAFLLTGIFERRQADDLREREAGKIPDDGLRHVVIIEEAHRLLARGQEANRSDIAGASAQKKSTDMIVDMLAEMRGLGQGLIIVEQIPTKIAPEVIKNSDIKIMLRLPAEDDRNYLGAAMNLSAAQKAFVTSLRAERGRGVDMVVFDQQLDQPRLLTLPMTEHKEVPIHQNLFEEM